VSGANTLQRTTFETLREGEYFNARELELQTGCKERFFGDAVLKELADNALDATEMAGVPPRVEISTKVEGELSYISVADNGPGIPPDVVNKIQNFTTRTSDKAAYRSPTRGAQGNALKTVIGIPYALGSYKPIVIEAKGVKQIINPRVDPGGRVRLLKKVEGSDRQEGTKVTVALPKERITFDPSYWTMAVSLFNNPHAFVKLERFEDGIYHLVNAFRNRSRFTNRSRKTSRSTSRRTL
jgi:DNA topoisomerase VI subunit B